MPSPASHLRAPLLWLLFPFMAGLTAAQLWPTPPRSLVPLALLAMALSGLAMWLASRSGRRQRASSRIGARASERIGARASERIGARASSLPTQEEEEAPIAPSREVGLHQSIRSIHHQNDCSTELFEPSPGEKGEQRPKRWYGIGWALCLCGASALGGFVLLHYREPQLHHWETQPPREITVTLLIQQLYPGAPQARSVSGLGKIVNAAAADRDLIGRRVYFSALKKISVPARRSGRYELHGVIEPLPREPAEASFNDFLANLGIRQKITRARLRREIAPPDRFEQFCTRAESRLEKILSHGLERHPEVSSLYLAMLLGEKAVLSPEQQNAFMRSGTFHILRCFLIPLIPAP